MIALLLGSAVEAYRIQASVSAEHVRIYHRYVAEQEIVYRLRRALYAASLDARDFLLSRRPDRETTFQTQLEQLQVETEAALDQLERLPAPAEPASRLRANIREFLATIEPLLDWTEAMRARDGFDFVQQEVVPRRNAIGDLMRELTAASGRALEDAEAEFSATRRGAGRRLFLIVGVCLAFGIAVAAWSLAYSERVEHEKARQYRAVEQARVDLAQLSAKLLEVQEEERKRLSRELHDEIGQTLTALRIDISHAHALAGSEAPAIAERLKRARLLAEKTLQTVRDTALLLRPSMLDDLGLGPALEWQAEEFTRRTGIPCEISENGHLDTLPDAHKTGVYRVVQEALHNCEIHARASRVRLSIQQAGDVLAIQVEDDGCGFRADENLRRSRGLGILGMRERAAGLSGALDLQSTPGRGTRLTLTIPVPSNGAGRTQPGQAKGVAV
jgi:signal transduction histidine kinase